ncbi:MAG: hypothetical protein U0031_01705 [Thermomicrobiales bacterium]
MRSSRIMVMMFVLFALGLGIVVHHPARAKESTPTVAGQHPLVGAWMLDGDVADPANPPEVVVFTADGLYIGADAFGGNTLGVWAPTGPRTAAITLAFPAIGSDGAPAGLVQVRGTVEVAADGQSFTAPYTLEIKPYDGSRSGEYGPGGATGTRMLIEPMGEPRGSLAELWASLQGTPVP